MPICFFLCFFLGGVLGFVEIVRSECGNMRES